MGRAKKGVEVTPLYKLNGVTKMDKLQEVYNQWYGCRRCELSLYRAPMQGPGGRMIKDEAGQPKRSDEIVFASGNPDASVMFVGEAPGEEEEATSVPFVGPSGKLLNLILANVSDDPYVKQMYEWYHKSPKSKKNDEDFNQAVFEWRDKEFFFTNAVSCRPPDNRTPNNIETKACYERLWNIIYVVDPLVIVAVGKTALTTLLHKNQEITKVRGQLFDVEYQGKHGRLTYPVVPILHPSYLLRKADWRVKGGDYEKTVGDVLKVMRIADELKNKNFGTPIPLRVSL